MTTLIVYFGALIAMFMATIDMQIVVTALPTIAGELGNLHLFGWVGAAYLLSTAAVSPFYGKLGDMYGRKNVVLTAIGLFLVGSLVCGMAWSMESLIAARVLQGIGGGGLMVSAFAMIGELFGPRDRAKYQGYSSAVFALSSVLGPLAGGYITSLFGWRWVFLVNLPIGIIVLAVLAFAMRSRFNEKRHRVDYLGGLLLAIGTTAIVYWGYHVLDPAGPDLSPSRCRSSRWRNRLVHHGRAAGRGADRALAAVRQFDGQHRLGRVAGRRIGDAGHVLLFRPLHADADGLEPGRSRLPVPAGFR